MQSTRLLLCAAALLSALACLPPVGDPSQDEAVMPSFLEGRNPRSWVRVYDPARAWDGFTLALFQRRIPILIDMNGRVVHSWPEARVKSRVRLMPDGSLLALALGRAVVQYDWEGRLIWEAPIEDAIPHHDVIHLANGNVMVLILREGKRTDDIIELDRAGRIVWEWRSAEHLTGYYDPDSRAGEITHLNSVQELPVNRWHDAGDQRFRPGNLLISARNMDAVFLIDRQTKEVVWSYDHELDRQHEALMIETGMPGAGNILLFDNGYASRFRYRASEIREIDPTTLETVWSYEQEGFYSPTGGIEQPLPNGNILVSSTRGGRAFEITREGRTVWEWVPGFEPNRPSRIARDHCPQLAALPEEPRQAVRPPAGYRHIDPRTYSYARPGAIAKVRIDGVERQALRQKGGCRRVLVPPRADLLLGFGLNKRAALANGRTGYTASFRATYSDGTGDSPQGVLLEETLTLSAPWRERSVALDSLAGAWLDLCLAIDSTEPAGEHGSTHFAFWTNPSIRPREASPSQEAAERALTPAEAEVERTHLKALGYVD